MKTMHLSSPPAQRSTFSQTETVDRRKGNWSSSALLPAIRTANMPIAAPSPPLAPRCSWLEEGDENEKGFPFCWVCSISVLLGCIPGCTQSARDAAVGIGIVLPFRGNCKSNLHMIIIDPLHCGTLSNNAFFTLKVRKSIIDRTNNHSPRFAVKGHLARCVICGVQSDQETRTECKNFRAYL